MATGEAFDHAVEHVIPSCPNLRIGLHLCLTNGLCHSKSATIPALADQTGNFRNGFLGIWKRIHLSRRETLNQIEQELRGQFERFLAAGIVPDHVNSHRHVHMIPGLFALVARLSREYRCRSVRISNELFPSELSHLDARFFLRAVRNFPKKILLSAFSKAASPHALGLLTSNSVCGILSSGHISIGVLLNSVALAKHGIVEVITHPGLVPAEFSKSMNPLDARFLRSTNRVKELDALCSMKARDDIENSGVKLTSFSQCIHLHKQPNKNADIPLNEHNHSSQ